MRAYLNVDLPYIICPYIIPISSRNPTARLRDGMNYNRGALGERGIPEDHRAKPLSRLPAPCGGLVVIKPPSLAATRLINFFFVRAVALPFALTRSMLTRANDHSALIDCRLINNRVAFTANTIPRGTWEQRLLLCPVYVCMRTFLLLLDPADIIEVTSLSIL